MTTDNHPAETLQQRVEPWLLACFGETIAADKVERNHRFLEEALELVQAAGCTQSEAHQLVDYVYGRPVGDAFQEAGGVMITLAALCRANGIDMHAAGEAELARIWTKVDQIRAKQAAKPKHSPLPAHPTGEPIAGREAPTVSDDMPHWKATQVVRSMERALVLNAVPAPNGKRWNDMADYLVMALSNAAALAQDNGEAAKPVAQAADDSTLPASVWLNDTGTSQKLSFSPIAGAYEHHEYRRAVPAIDASAAQDALAQIASRDPVLQDSTHGPRWRCRACGYAWVDGKEVESHSALCAYEIARAALRAEDGVASPQQVDSSTLIHYCVKCHTPNGRANRAACYSCGVLFAWPEVPVVNQSLTTPQLPPGCCGGLEGCESRSRCDQWSESDQVRQARHEAYTEGYRDGKAFMQNDGEAAKPVALLSLPDQKEREAPTSER